MRLADFIPQPFRNIYDNSVQLQKPVISYEEQVFLVEKIVKDIFRLLLIIPLVGTTVALSGLEASPFVNLGLLIILPQSQLLALATMSLIASTALIIHTIASSSFVSLTGAVVFGFIAYFASEKYERVMLYSIENYLITPLSAKLAEMLV